MNISIRGLISFVAVVFFALGLSCGGCDDNTAAAGGTGFDTDSCTVDADCLGVCTDGTCTDGGSTGFDGEECESDDQCRGTCEGDVCTGAGTGDDGAECDTDGECKGQCVDGTCADDPTNNTTGTNNTTNNTTGTNNTTNNTTVENSTTNFNSGSGTAFCGDRPCECDDGIDNDGDGLIDGADPHCASPYDDDEGSFATGIPGDNVDFCQDCFFDGNSGHGDDGCQYHSDCLYGLEPSGGGSSCFDCEVSQQCVDFCRPRTPNGCDCFGCCEVRDDDGEIHTIVRVEGCSLDNLDDEDACPRCVQSQDCVNECGRCELCPGKTVDDLPDDCTADPGDGGDGDPCEVDGDCAGGDCEADTCSGDGSGGEGDPCTQDGDCTGTSTCGDDGSCGGGSGGEITHTCDDGEQVCTVSGDCPNNYYCQQGCCLEVIN